MKRHKELQRYDVDCFYPDEPCEDGYYAHADDCEEIIGELKKEIAEGLIRENNLQFELMNRRREIDSLRKDIEDRTWKAAE